MIRVRSTIAASTTATDKACISPLMHGGNTFHVRRDEGVNFKGKERD